MKYLPPTPERSALMARIRSKDTRPELTVRRMVHALGYRYVLHDRRLPGTPDLVFPSRHAVIFVDGCFWHGHDCGKRGTPKRNADFWERKIARNMARDRRDRRALRRLGWRVLVVRECAIRGPALVRLQLRLIAFLEGV